MNDFRHRFGLEPETLLGDQGQESRAGLEARIVKLPIAGIAFEVLRILWRQECALMVIEPPGDFSRTGILEVHDGVLVSIEFSLVEEGPRSMQQA